MLSAVIYTRRLWIFSRQCRTSPSEMRSLSTTLPCCKRRFTALHCSCCVYVNCYSRAAANTSCHRDCPRRQSDVQRHSCVSVSYNANELNRLHTSPAHIGYIGIMQFWANCRSLYNTRPFNGRTFYHTNIGVARIFPVGVHFIFAQITDDLLVIVLFHGLDVLNQRVYCRDRIHSAKKSGVDYVPIPRVAPCTLWLRLCIRITVYPFVLSSFFLFLR